MEQNYFDKNSDPFKKLQELFGKDEINEKNEKCERLEEILKATEEAWKENLEKVTRPVKYLLIAEAPPWREKKEKIAYFYLTFEGSWVKRIWNTFFPRTDLPKKEEGLKKLAEEGFLLLDSLPYAMKYSSYQRKKYGGLVSVCVPYWKSKLKEVIIFDENVKVALAFKLNGCALINACRDNKTKFPDGQKLVLNENSIAVDSSNYTSSKRLREIFGLEKEKNQKNRKVCTSFTP